MRDFVTNARVAVGSFDQSYNNLKGYRNSFDHIQIYNIHGMKENCISKIIIINNLNNK